MRVRKGVGGALKVGFATSQFGPGFNQGAETYIENLATGLAEKGWAVHVFSALKSGDGELLAHGDSTSHEALGGSGWCAVFGASVDFFCRKLQSSQIDILHLVHPGHLGTNIVRAAHRCGIPVVITLVDYWWLCPKNTLIRPDGSICKGQRTRAECQECVVQSHRLNWINEITALWGGSTRILAVASDAFQVMRGKSSSKNWEFRSAELAATLDSADSIIALSRTAKDRIQPLVANQEIALIPVGLAPRWFDREAESSNERNDRIVVGFAGSIAPHKGLHTLISAVKSLSGFELHLAGPISDFRYWQAQQQSLEDIEFRYYGSISKESMPSFIDAVDVMVVPSLSPENQPQTVLEAQARGKPVVVSSVPGAAELQPNSNLIFEAGDVSDLVKVLRGLSTEAFDYSQPKPSTIEEMTGRTAELYSKILSNRNK